MGSTSKRIRGLDRLFLLPSGSEVSTQSGAPSVQSGAPGVVPDYYLDWRSVSPGSSDAILTENGKADERWGGTGSLDIVTAASVGVSGLPASITNVLRVAMGTGDFDWVMIRSKFSAPAVGQTLSERMYLLNNIADSGPSGSIDFGSAYAATHPKEYRGSSGGIAGNFVADHTGARPSGKFEYYVDVDAVGRQYTPGGIGGADPPLTLSKGAWWRIEKQWPRTADVSGSPRFSCHIRIYDSAGVLQYSDADGKNNMSAWGVGLMSVNNTNLPIDLTAMAQRRLGINGGGNIVAGNRPQYQYWAGYAMRIGDWLGPHTVNG